MKTMQDHQIEYVHERDEYGKRFVDLLDMTPTTRRQFTLYIRGRSRPTIPGYENVAWAKDWYMWLGYRQGKRVRR